MTATAADLLCQAQQLAPPDRAELAEKLWEGLVNLDEDALPAGFKAELDRRIDESECNPSRGIPWELAKTRIRERR